MKQQIVQELNWLRTKPLEVIEALRERLAQYKGKDYFPPARQGASVVTKEGTAVVEEAIEYVRGLETMDGVGNRSEEGLALAAEDHIADIGQTGTASHTSSDGMSSAERASQYGYYGLFGECLWYGSDLADARTIILDLIVDDGVASRGHRKGVLNPRYDTVGVAYGPHATFGRMAAIEFAKSWEPKAMFIRSRLQTGPRTIDARLMSQAKQNAETQWSLGTCPVCNEAIKGGKVIEVPEMGARLHGACYKCSSCACSLLGGVERRLHRKELYCKDCFLEKHGDSCSAGDPGSKPGSRPGSGRSARLSAAGAASIAASPKALAAKAGAKAKAKPKPAPKMSMGKAKTSAMAIAMDYANLG